MNLASRQKGKSSHATDFASAKSAVKLKRNLSGIKSFGDFGKKNRDKDKNGKVKSKLSKFIKKAAIISSLSFLFLMFFGIVCVLAVVAAYSNNLPNADEFVKRSADAQNETVIMDRTGKIELYKLRGDAIKERVYIQDVPSAMKWAFVAAEDEDFYTHRGLNISGIVRAASCAVRNTYCGGGSSITQQLVKQATNERQGTLERKIQEAINAMRIEQSYNDKDKILEYYLNVVPEGYVLNGVKSGSKHLYGKELKDLSLAEISFLAGIPNQPDIFSPWGGNYDPKQSQDRALYVLSRLEVIRDRTGISQADIDKAKAEVPTVQFKKNVVQKRAPHFVNFALQDLDKLYADKADQVTKEKGSDYLRGKGWKVITSVDVEAQELLQNTLKNNINNATFQARTGAQNAAGVIMDPKTGEILAIVGSRDFYYEGAVDKRIAPEFNSATSRRSMGSSTKVITYLALMMKGYNPSSVMPDLRLDQRAGASDPSYIPKNYSGAFGVNGSVAQNTSKRGDFMSIRGALAFSLNQPAVSAFNVVGADAWADTYIKLNGDESFREQVKGPAATLGAANLSLLNQVHAFNTIAAEGVYKPKKTILKIIDAEGKIIYDNTKVEGKQVVDRKFTYMITDMNRDYYFFGADPTIQKIKKAGYDFAGKTGTSDVIAGGNGVGDINFVAYTPTITIGMWAGNSCSPTEPGCAMKNGAESKDLYDYIYKPFLEAYYTKIPKSEPFKQPGEVRNVSVCSYTGNAMSNDCIVAGGRAVTTMAADTALPRQEFMLEKAMVTKCPDNFKIARQVDIDAGVAEEKVFVAYYKIFPQKWINDQIYANLKSRNAVVPKETCNIDRAIKKNQITFVSPAEGGSYSKQETLSIIADISGDVPIQKVDFYLDNQQPNIPNVKWSLTSAPYKIDLPLNSPQISLGSHSITIVLTDSTGELKSTRTFTVTSNPTVKPSSQRLIPQNGPIINNFQNKLDKGDQFSGNLNGATKTYSSVISANGFSYNLPIDLPKGTYAIAAKINNVISSLTTLTFL